MKGLSGCAAVAAAAPVPDIAFSKGSCTQREAARGAMPSAMGTGIAASHVHVHILLTRRALEQLGWKVETKTTKGKTTGRKSVGLQIVQQGVRGRGKGGTLGQTHLDV